jgi:hypothetical protein
MASRKNVPAATVRAWFKEAQPEGVPAPGSRGRLHPDTIAAFHKANKGLRYETASEAEKPTITVPVVSLDKAGRKVTKNVTLTTEAARAALGHPSGRRGRFDKGALSLALSAPLADEVADQFV